MVVIAYFPPKGIIDTLLIQDVNGRCQTIAKQSKSASWYVGQSWSSSAVKKTCLDRGFVTLPVPIDFGTFLKNIDQYGSKS